MSPQRLAPLVCAESGLDARERSTAELGAPGASQEPGCCKLESSSRAAGVSLPLSDRSSDAHRASPEPRRAIGAIRWLSL
jgi:hypothetical protein